MLDAAHDHAEVAGFHDDGDAAGFEDLANGVGDFFGEAFLDLEAASVHFGDAGEFGEADDGVVGDVADVHLEGVSVLVGDCVCCYAKVTCHGALGVIILWLMVI